MTPKDITAGGVCGRGLRLYVGEDISQLGSPECHVLHYVFERMVSSVSWPALLPQVVVAALPVAASPSYMASRLL